MLDSEHTTFKECTKTYVLAYCQVVQAAFGGLASVLIAHVLLILYGRLNHVKSATSGQVRVECGSPASVKHLPIS